MKTFLRLTVLVLLANLFQLSFAYDFKVGQLYYNINSDGATVSVTGENARPPAYPYESLRGDVVIPSTVTYNGVTYTVTEIGSGAFDGAVGVVNVSVPQTVTRIAGYSFRDCTNLKSINIPTAVTTIDGGTFWGCTALTSFTIPNTVTSIGSYAFKNCTALATITVPDNLRDIAYQAFENTAWLNNAPDGLLYAGNVLYKYKGSMPAGTNITLRDGTIAVGTEAFYECSNLVGITIPSSVTLISSNAFYKCTGLTSINIPSAVTDIYDWAFASCTGLTSVTIPSKVTHICNSLFRNCTGLVEVNLPSGITRIDTYAFKGCTGLTEFTVPPMVTEIWEEAFCDCTNLASITFPENDFYVGQNAFTNTAWWNSLPNGVVYVGKTAYKCKGTTLPSGTVLTIKDGTESIASDAFYACTGLQKVIFPNSLKTIDYCAFMDCLDLADIEMPNTLVRVGSAAFENTAWLNNAPDGVVYLGKVAYCYKGEMPAGTSITLRDGTLATAEGAFESQDNLTGVTLPNTLSVIGGYAFCWSRGLKSINFPNSIIEIGDGAFDNCTGLENIFSEIIRPANVRLGYGVFYDVPTATCVLHIPVGALGRYGAAEQWKDFVNMVEDQGGDLLGDLDGNGLLEVNDVVVLAEYAMSGGASAEATALGDMDGNGLIEVNDVVILAGLVMGS